MADFCKQCSIDTFGKDYGDMAGISTKANTNAGLFASVICEGCGFIQVDHEGRCVSPTCLENHNQPKEPTNGNYIFDSPIIPG